MTFKTLTLALAGGALLTSTALAEDVVIDLTHAIPTFQPSEADPMAPDLSKPWGDSQPIPSFGAQTVLAISQFPVGDGYFDLGTLVLAEHHATHLDTPGHFLNNEATLEEGNSNDRRLAHDMTAQDLVGPMVLIDISGRVQAELDKNGGQPSPDTAVTDFSNSSMNVVTAEDINAVADELEDGSWVVLNLGWSGFYHDMDFATSPYINGWNYPGINKAAVDRLLEIQAERGIKINGLIADNIGIDSGESSIGENGDWTNSWHAHARLLQHDIKLVENAANLGALTDAEDCTIVVGALKHVHGTGGASRVIALCDM